MIGLFVCSQCFTLSMLGKNSAYDSLKYFSKFFEIAGFVISYELYPLKRICMICKRLILGENNNG